ncbi:MAG: hypothetical protein ACTSVV_04945 [Promethearchaeota archaeon]
MNTNFNKTKKRASKNIIFIPKDIIETLEKYINEHKEMVFKNVSEFIIYLIREKIRKLVH